MHKNENMYNYKVCIFRESMEKSFENKLKETTDSKEFSQFTADIWIKV